MSMTEAVTAMRLVCTTYNELCMFFLGSAIYPSTSGAIGGKRNLILPGMCTQPRQRCTYSLHMTEFLTKFALIPKMCEMVHLSCVICTCT